MTEKPKKAKKDKSDAGGEDVWDRAHKALDKCTSYQAEADELKVRLTAYADERRAAEAQGNVPRGVRRRGERLLEEVAALAARPERAAEASESEDGEHKVHASRKRSRTSRSDAAPAGRPTRSTGRSARGQER